MKKIMFNDKLRLTQAVLTGRKTQTRREIKCPRTQDGIDVAGFEVRKSFTGFCEVVTLDYDGREIGALEPTYKIGEIIAIAQSYEEIYKEMKQQDAIAARIWTEIFQDRVAWRNKMFVEAAKMLHYIKITNIRVERLQDISDEDCLKEGIKREYNIAGGMYEYRYPMSLTRYATPQEAYAHLIDKISGKGTWAKNLWEWVIDFESLE